MLLEHWHFPATTCEVIRCQLEPEKAGEGVSLLAALQFTLRLLPLTGMDFTNQAGRLSETDPFVRASSLTPALISQIVSKCRDDFQRVLQSVALD
jgi:HD-like signal output (HDOD) protein